MDQNSGVGRSYANINLDRQDRKDMDLAELVHAAMTKGGLTKKAMLPSGSQRHLETVSLRHLTKEQKQRVVEEALQSKDADAERFFTKIQERMERANIPLAQVEVRFQDLSVEANIAVGSSGLPSVYNTYKNALLGNLQKVHLWKTKKTKFTILDNLSGILHPGRFTLLLGPPGAGKSTLLNALAGRLQKHPTCRVKGNITYNGQGFDKFVAVHTAAYVDQNDLHQPELTVRETFNFAARVQEELAELQAREKEKGIEPDWEIDAFMKAQVREGKKDSIVTEMIIKMLGLDVCADTFIGNDQLRGVSGGQRKRVTTGEMIVGPKKTLFLDEISTGLDSSTTFQITRTLREFSHIRKATVLVALLQPTPETYNLFDDIMLLSEGQMVFHGPREEIVGFFSALHMKVPERKAVPDFLQEVTSVKDQKQYYNGNAPYKYIPVIAFTKAFKQTPWARQTLAELSEPYQAPNDKCMSALVTYKYALGRYARLKALMNREFTLIKRTFVVYKAKTIQVIFMSIVSATLYLRTHIHDDTPTDGNLKAGFIFFGSLVLLFNGIAELSMTCERLPVFWKQQRMQFFDAVSFMIPATLQRIPFSLTEGFVWTVLTYWAVGLAGEPGRFFMFMLLNTLIHQVGLCLYRSISSATRNIVIANAAGMMLLLCVFLMNGFVIRKNFVHPWVVWIFWADPLQYATRALMINEFTAEHWQGTKRYPYAPYQDRTLGDGILLTLNMPNHYWWVWVGVGALFAYIIGLNFVIAACLAYLPPWGANDTHMMTEEEMAARDQALMGEHSSPDSVAISIPEDFTKSVPPQGKQSVSDSDGSKDGKVEMTPKGHDEAKGDDEAQPLQGRPLQWQPGSAVRLGSEGIPPAFDANEYHRHPEAFPSVRHFEPHTHSKVLSGAPLGPVGPAMRGPGTNEPRGMNGMASQNGNAHSDDSEGRGHKAPSKGASQLDREDLTEEQQLDGGKRDLSAKSSKKSKESLQGEGMVLPFDPMTLTFKDLHYFVEIPKDASEGREHVTQEGGQHWLELLLGISGAFRPGVLTCLMGVSGAGKTTLMDVLAGRKTGGRIEGDIRVNGYPKEQDSFARVSGYVEQFDTHSAATTVREALIFSGVLRNEKDVDMKTTLEFVDQVMGLVELQTLSGALVGTPGQSGLSVEQRKRLTIAVELVANPSIVFMDEPTSGLDARAAAIVMRTVRNIVNTGRTIVCTIHQPSIDIFEAFDELLLLKRGGETIFNGRLGKDSSDLVEYFQSVQGVPRIRNDLNPATWMLEVTTPGMESQLGVNFAEFYNQSPLAKHYDQLLTEYSAPKEGSQQLKFDTKYPKPMYAQFVAIFTKFMAAYWRMPEYNGTRFLLALGVGFTFGAMFWRLGDKITTQAGLTNVLGALYATTLFFSIINATVIQPVISAERAVTYRERAAGMYSTFPWVAAIGCVEIIYLSVQSLVYCSIVYWMCWFQRDAGKFFWFVLYNQLSLTFFTFFGMVAVALTPNMKLAAVCSAYFYSLFNLFAGFAIQQPHMPGWWIWFSWINPIFWTVYGLIMSQIDNLTTPVTLQDGSVVTPYDAALITFGYHRGKLGWAVLIMVAWVFICWTLTFVALWKLNFLK
eukprot:jgi/Astpho2/5171/Aster-04755